MKSTVTRALSIAALLGISMIGEAQAGKYGSAGCGLGALIIGDEKGPVQIVAALLNNLVVPQTSAISTGTLECTEDGVALKDKEQEFFANVNFESLNQEIAQGHGENLQAFAYLFGCTGSGVEKFSDVAHSNYSTIFPSEKTNSVEMLSNIQGIMKSNPEMQASCSENG